MPLKSFDFHPRFVVDENGKPTEAIIPYDEYLRLREMLEDILDLACVESRRKEKGIPLQEVRRELEEDGIV